MNCRQCGAPMSFNATQFSYHCAYCGSIYIPEPDEEGIRFYEEPGTYNCPVCNLPMKQALVENYLHIQLCPKCRGILAAQEKFGLAVRNLRARAKRPSVEPGLMEWDGLRRTVNCPSCGKRMSTHPYGGPGNIIIDACTTCGLVFLDYKELRRILDTPGRDRRA